MTWKKYLNLDNFKNLDRKLILAIDFDGTIVENKFPDIGKLKHNAKEVINYLYDFCFIIIYTCRGGSELVEAKNFLDREGIKYHKINENAPFDMIGFLPTSKIYADIYIDDKNLLTVLDWLEIKKIMDFILFDKSLVFN